MRQPLRHRLTGLAALALALAATVGVNLWADGALRGHRIDLSEDRRHALDAATRAVLGGLSQPVTLRLVVSDQLAAASPALAGYARRVEARLEDYAAAAGDRLTLRREAPEPFSDAEDRAVQDGLLGLPLTKGGDPIYFGLAGSSTADRVAIPFLRPEEEPTLDLQLTRMIARLASPDRRQVAVVSTLPLGGALAFGGRVLPAFTAYRDMQADFDLRPIAINDLAAKGTAALDPAEIDVLLLVHPRDLPPTAQYAIDQFLMAGGRALVLVDPLSEAAAERLPDQAARGASFSALGLFGTSWGLALDIGRVAGDRALASSITVRRDDGRPLQLQHLVWLTLGERNRDAADPAFAGLGPITVGTAGILRPLMGATTSFSPLLFTSDHGTPVDVGEIVPRADPQALWAAHTSGNERLVLAARVGGHARSAFADQPPDGVPADAAATRKVETDALDLVVIADTDILDDRFWVARGQPGQPARAFAANGDFLLALLEELSGTQDLSALRNRAAGARPFTRIAEIGRAAAARLQDSEAALTERLAWFQRDMAAAQGAEGGAEPSLQAIEDLRAKVVGTRQELREVRQALRADVETIERALIWLNVAAIPATILLLTFMIMAIRPFRRRFRMPR
ncbi:Gldg family protein [Inquilinus sp. NPDC058860]|uniref:Gldg family protein n=1 Tax=Inquilinus sp. NPDC058860 TaxID=3346652 RepID=UPI0036BD2CD7